MRDNMIRLFAGISTFSLLCFGGAAASNGASLASDGQAKASIVVASDCSGLVSAAAMELQRYVEKMSGAKLPIIKIEKNPAESLQKASRDNSLVLIGENSYTRELGVSADGLSTDGYQIGTLPNVLFIIGKDTYDGDPRLRRIEWSVGSVGTLRGVYRLLEEMGVRWFYPTEAGEVVPRKTELSVENLDIKDAPYFSYRNGISACDCLDPKWYWKIGFGTGEFIPDAQPHPFTYWMDKYKDTHPEYFAVFGGKPDSRQVCFTSPAARQRMLQDVRNFFAAYPYGKNYFTVLHNDGYVRSCECENCRSKIVNGEGWSGSDSNIVAEASIGFANAIAKERPDGMILIGAYNKCIRPPTNVEKLPDNVAVIICKHSRLHQWSEDYKKNVNEVIEGWRKLKPKEIFFWEYYGHGWGFGFAPHFIASDIKHLKEISEEGPRIAGERIFGDFYGPTLESRTWWFDLNTYITAKCLWNPDIDVDVLLEDFYEKFFGPAKEPMKRFFTRAEENWVKGNHGVKWEYGDKSVDAQLRDRRTGKITLLIEDPDARFVAQYDSRTLKELSGFLEEAKSLAKDSPYRERVQSVEKGFRYTEEYAKASSERLAKKAVGNAVEIYRAKSAPVIDGIIEKRWGEEGVGMDFKNNATGSSLAPYGTTAHLSYTGERLYLAFSCNKVEGEPLVAGSDHVWSDESIEIFISPDAENRNAYYHMAVNSAGKVYAAGPSEKSGWNPDLEVGVKTGLHSWELELSLPFDSLGKVPSSTGAWAINLYRSRHSTEGVEQQALFPTYGAGYHQPASFGKLSFCEKPDIEKGLVGYWKFDEGEGIKAADSSGNGNHGVLQGNPQWTDGKEGRAVNFDGTGDYVECKGSESLNVKDGITISAWVKMPDVSLSGQTIASRRKGGTDQPYALAAIYKQSPRFWIGTPDYENLDSSLRIETDKWCHIAGTYNGGTMQIYVNGKLSASKAHTGTITPSDGPLYIGARYYQGFSFLKGCIDEVRIYNRALSSAEVRMLCNN